MKKNSKGRFNQKVFNKLFITSSITIVVTVIFLIVAITHYYSDIIIQKEVNIQTRMLERVEEYFSAKDEDITRAKRDLYMNNEIIDHMTYALQNGYEGYLEYRLDQFSDSESFFPTTIDTYVNSYFGQDSNVNAVSLHSLEAPNIEYLLIFNNIRWNRSLVEKTHNDFLPPIPPSYPERAMQGLPKTRSFKNTIIKKITIYNPVVLERIGELSIYYSTDRLDKIVKKQEGTPSAFFLLDQDGEVVYSVSEDIPKEIIEKVNHETNETIIQSDHGDYYVNTIANKGDFTYVSVIPDKGWKKLSIIRGTMWALIISFITISILIIYTFTRNYSKRINQIVSTIRQVEAGNLEARVQDSKHEDELSKIGLNINSMLNELDNYIEKVYVLNIKQQQAELKALQAQIDPHFLFNTLEAIRMVAVVDGSKTSAKMIFHLSKLFRYSLESNDIVPLYTEIEYVKQYLNLMQFKYPDKLDVEFDIGDDVAQVCVQKLILQPVIENYFIHGFKKDKRDNKLTIRVKNCGDWFQMMIEDNGKGMEKSRLAEVKGHIVSDTEDGMSSIGLRNIHQRLKYKYGEPYGLDLESNEEKGLTVTLSMPIKEGEACIKSF